MFAISSGLIPAAFTNRVTRLRMQFVTQFSLSTSRLRCSRSSWLMASEDSPDAPMTVNAPDLMVSRSFLMRLKSSLLTPLSPRTPSMIVERTEASNPSSEAAMKYKIWSDFFGCFPSNCIPQESVHVLFNLWPLRLRFRPLIFPILPELLASSWLEKWPRNRLRLPLICLKICKITCVA